MIRHHDVLIIGGGLTGLRAALRISDAGLTRRRPHKKKHLCPLGLPYSRNTTTASPYGQWCSKLPGSVLGSGSSFLAECA